MKLISAYISLLFLLSPGVALAAGGESAGFSSLLFPAINFALFALLMNRIYVKKIKGLLKGRKVSIASNLGQAKKNLVEAEEGYKGLCDRLSSIEGEKRELFARFDTEGSNLSKMIIENAVLQSKRIEVDAQRQIDSELSRSTAELKKQAIEKAIRIAQEDLKSGLSTDKDKLLRDEALNCLVTEGEDLGRQGA